jgi:hypothetical protein
MSGMATLQSAKKDVKTEMQREFDRQTAKYAELFEAFAKEDPSAFRKAK